MMDPAFMTLVFWSEM